MMMDPFRFYSIVTFVDSMFRPPARVNVARTAVAPTDHSNPKNKAIHLLFVWPILWTGLALLASFCPLGSLPPGVLEHLPFRDVAWNLHLGTPLTLAYVFVYLGEQASERRGSLCRYVVMSLCRYAPRGLGYRVGMDGRYGGVRAWSASLIGSPFPCYQTTTTMLVRCWGVGSAC